MASIEFTAFPRQGGEGRGASRRLRTSGKAPGIVYGGGAEPTQIELDHNALIHALRNENSRPTPNTGASASESSARSLYRL